MAIFTPSMPWITIILNNIRNFFKWFADNPKATRLILEVAAVVWIVICCLTHCGSGRGGSGDGSDTLSVDVDTNWVYPDTNLILHLKGFDTIPEEVEVDETPNWEIPPTNFDDAKNCKDSLIILRKTLFAANYIMDQCDSLYRWHTARRVYNDTLENDSIKLYSETVVKGFRIGEPTIGYTWLRPQPVITKTITLIDTVGPYRKIYLGGGLGARLPWESDRLDAIVGSLGFGYTDKKRNSYGIRGDFSQSDYAVQFEYRKSFNVGK